MLKPNEWYFVPKHNNPTLPDNALGTLNKVVEVSNDTLYASTEQWVITEDRKYIHRGVYQQTDSVYLTKYGKKVNPPSKMFQILNSETVNGVKEKSTVEQIIDSEDEYNED